MSTHLRLTMGLLLSVTTLAACAGSGSDTDSMPMRVTGEPNAGPETPAPTDAEALASWLENGSYEAFSSESNVHESAGPHTFVKVFLSSALVQSLQAGNESHPVGSVAVKERYDQEGGPLSGWSVAIKTADMHVKEDWLWYERAPGGDAPTVNRNGESFCASCHQGGRDYVWTELPLR